MKVSAATVVDAFRTALQSSDRAELVSEYAKHPTWTQRMGKVVTDAWRRMNAAVGRETADTDCYPEMYTFDWAFRCEANSCHADAPKRWWPANPFMLVESENGEHPEEEMWKLAHWRAPYKILFIRDWSEKMKQERLQKPGKDDWRRWLGERIEDFRHILSLADESLPENPETRYIIFVANQPSPDDIHWHVYEFNTAGRCVDRTHFSLSGNAAPKWALDVWQDPARSER